MFITDNLEENSKSYMFRFPANMLASGQSSPKDHLCFRKPPKQHDVTVYPMHFTSIWVVEFFLIFYKSKIAVRPIKNEDSCYINKASPATRRPLVDRHVKKSKMVDMTMQLKLRLFLTCNISLWTDS